MRMRASSVILTATIEAATWRPRRNCQATTSQQRWQAISHRAAAGRGGTRHAMFWLMAQSTKARSRGPLLDRTKQTLFVPGIRRAPPRRHRPAAMRVADERPMIGKVRTIAVAPAMAIAETMAVPETMAVAVAMADDRTVARHRRPGVVRYRDAGTLIGGALIDHIDRRRRDRRRLDGRRRIDDRLMTAAAAAPAAAGDHGQWRRQRRNRLRIDERGARRGAAAAAEARAPATSRGERGHADGEHRGKTYKNDTIQRHGTPCLLSLVAEADLGRPRRGPPETHGIGLWCSPSCRRVPRWPMTGATTIGSFDV